MKHIADQAELFGLERCEPEYPYRLRVHDLIRIDHRLGLVIRVTSTSADVLVNRPPRRFFTRFGKHVYFHQPPKVIHRSPNSEVEIIYRGLKPRH
jgi:hypothetical protein